MKRTWVAVLMLAFASAGMAQEKPAAKPESESAAIQAQVHKLWAAFQKKDKATLSSLIDDNFRMFEEGLSAFADKKAEVNAVDEFELVTFTLSDFHVTPTGPNTALVTYIAQYEGKTGSESSRAKSVFAEMWIRHGNEWKDLYLQETYVK